MFRVFLSFGVSGMHAIESDASAMLQTVTKRGMDTKEHKCFCTKEYAPVCAGENKQVYSNSCQAQCEGAILQWEGAIDNWTETTCARKKRNGKCSKGNVRSNCAKTCCFSAEECDAMPRVFPSDEAKGGSIINPLTTALVLIEFQNEFVTEGGKLHDAVKAVMVETDMMQKTADLIIQARNKGVKIFHTPITFKADMSNNPNKALGILGNCNDGDMFVEDTWNANISDLIPREDTDILIRGKHGLDAFPGTTLEQELKEHGIETLAIAGLLTNCCCESTMRTAYEKGFNVVMIHDCMATTSPEAHQAAVDFTFPMFSTPMTAADFTNSVLQ